MKRKGPIPTIAWVLVGILVIAGVSLSLDKTSSQVFPSVSSYAPSGTRAFSDLLQEQGYVIDVSTSSGPDIHGSPILIAFFVDGDLSPVSTGAEAFIQDYVDRGGSAANFFLSQDLQTATDQAGNVVTLSQSYDPKVRLKVNMGQVPDQRLEDSSGLSLSSPDDKFYNPAYLTLSGSGKELDVQDGIVATNRFIDQNDNAEQLVRWIRAIAPPKSHLLFMESSFGNGSVPGIFDALGSWSYPAWLELLFLFLVIIYTLGKPFGYADEERRKQRGARDLVEAVAYLYRRSHASSAALSRAYEDADFEIRNRLKLPPDAASEQRDAKLPADLASAMTETRSWSKLRVKPGDALRQVKKLDKLLADFLGEKREVRRRRKIT